MINRQTGAVEKKKPRFVRSNTVINCRIEVTKPIAVEKFSDVQHLGRFTLRDGGKTIAFGKILDFKKAAAPGSK